MDSDSPRSRHRSNRSFLSPIAPSSSGGVSQKWTGMGDILIASPQLCKKQFFAYCNATWIAHSKGSSRIPLLPALEKWPLRSTSQRLFLYHEAPIATAATEHSKLRLLKPVIVSSSAFQCLEIEHSPVATSHLVTTGTPNSGVGAQTPSSSNNGRKFAIFQVITSRHAQKAGIAGTNTPQITTLS